MVKCKIVNWHTIKYFTFLWMQKRSVISSEFGLYFLGPHLPSDSCISITAGNNFKATASSKPEKKIFNKFFSNLKLIQRKKEHFIRSQYFGETTYFLLNFHYSLLGTLLSPLKSLQSKHFVYVYFQRQWFFSPNLANFWGKGLLFRDISS